MTKRIAERSNDAWLRALERDDAESREAMRELADYLARILRKVLRDRPALTDAELEDLVQDTLLRLVESRHTFRGDSAFTTWAAAIATRVAFTQFRRRAVRERGRSPFEHVRDDAVATASSEDPLVREEILGALRSAIDRELTDRQRIAILAELRGIPTVEIADQLGTNTNALYKLVHDARKRLRNRLEREGFGAEPIREFRTRASHP